MLTSNNGCCVIMGSGPGPRLGGDGTLGRGKKIGFPDGCHRKTNQWWYGGGHTREGASGLRERMGDLEKPCSNC